MSRFRIGSEVSGARPLVAGAGILAAAILFASPAARAGHALAPAGEPPAVLRLAQDEVAFGRGEVVIETRAGARRFTVEIARTTDQRRRGLMYRTELARDGGMLFVFDRPGVVRMWMKDTLIPLDMLFLARDGRVVRVVERAVPGSLRTISSGEAVAAVLELNGGTASRLEIAPGDRVIHPALGGGS